ncbi:SUMF1/EgtB/PvdO family nonheme iron enzyme [Cellulophaga sp. BC115SP]|uniref:SUMF1/EgtB/PvdO family nonheme iron enzyme n=1 Tax=Cellulophaga sp. BC115SP TaxID=2683263 RepID=UPI001411F60A|nr:SUMF1/EgtB/PvdO family nonheme iron enzyme [Cellulophaga sp. BC115SP]NBB31507.1 SUMF1/EgtB/PvdO family nonheme iron enzyme [Cellulophaga sp. BC115SP]
MRLPYYLILYFISFSLQSWAQEKGMKPIEDDIQNEKRLALVIGIKKYRNLPPLKNTLNDANDMARELSASGFEVILKEDLDKSMFNEALEKFGQKLKNNNVGLLYYSGHGIQYNGETYLIPTNAVIKDSSDVDANCIRLSDILEIMSKSHVEISLVISDACRNTPKFKNSATANNNFKIPGGFKRGYIAFATSINAPADDNQYGNNGAFTGELLKYISIPELSIGEIMQKTRNSLNLKFEQITGIYDQLGSDFYFKKRIVAIEPDTQSIPAGTEEIGTDATEEEDAYPAHIVDFTSFAMGKYEVTQSQFKLFVAETSYKTDAEKNGFSYVFHEDSIKVLRQNINWRNDERGELVGNDPQSAQKPVIHVSWNDANEYCKWLTEKAQLKGEIKVFRLPTESEWEYVAKVSANKGSKGVQSSDNKGYQDWHLENSGKKIHKVGEKIANKFQVYDINGNVSEWCSDWFGRYSSLRSSNPKGSEVGDYKVFRGGNWSDSIEYSQPFSRSYQLSTYTSYNLGFRVCYSK